MKTFAQKFTKSAAALALGASVLTTAVVATDSTASAKDSHKISHGKLINSKSHKTVKGYKVFKSKLYKNGVKFSGNYKGKYYKVGNLYSGVKNKTLYKKGEAFTGEVGHCYYKHGKKFTGKTKADRYYFNGVLANGIFELNGKNVQFKNGKIVADRIAPIITLEDGAKPVYFVKNGEEFKAPIATAKDNLDKTIDVTTTIFDSHYNKLDKIDTTKAGTYFIKYTAKDANFNTSNVKVKVIVELKAVAPTTDDQNVQGEQDEKDDQNAQGEQTEKEDQNTQGEQSETVEK